MIRRSQLRLSQTFLRDRSVSWNQLNLEILRDGHQRCLELVILDIIRIRWLRFTSHDLVGGENTYERSVEEALGDELSGAGA